MCMWKLFLLLRRSKYHFMGLSWPTWRTEHLALLDVMRLDVAHWSSLCRSLYRTYRLAVPLKLVSPVNSLRVHLIPSFTSLIKMLKLVPILSPREHLWWSAANRTEFHSLWQFEPSHPASSSPSDLYTCQSHEQFLQENKTVKSIHKL